MTLRFSGPLVTRLLAVNFLALLLFGTASEVALHGFGITWFFGLVPMSNLSYEGNLPTWYASMLLLTCAGLLGLIGWTRFRAARPYRWHWLILALVFLYISMDELAVIHETLNRPLREALDLGGLFHFAWVIPFGLLVLVFALSYIGFLRHLPPRFALWFVAAGAVYVGGALGTELPISLWYEGHGGDNLVYGLMNLAQEGLELLGASIFCAGLATYIMDQIGDLRLSFT